MKGKNLAYTMPSGSFYFQDPDPQWRSIDLFAGIGGIRLGFDQAFAQAINTVFVSEWDLPAQKTYRANFNDPFPIVGDITKVDERTIPPFDICLAGFPCQAFSMAGRREGFKDNYKGLSRGTLFQDVVRICDYHKPVVIFCENVKGLYHHDKGRTFMIIKGAFEEIGYKVFSKVLNSKDFGVPQNRERIYIVCFRNDIAPNDFEFPQPLSSSKTTIRDILEEPPINPKYYLSEVYLQTLIRHKAHHAALGHGFGYEIRSLDGIAGTLVCGGMGRERNLVIDHREHSKIPVTKIKGKINAQDIRKMTPREWARLQGFPDSFALPLADVHLYKQFGNTVTVNVVEAIAKKIKEVLDMTIKGNKGEWSEPYAALRILGDQKLFIADKDGKKNNQEWLQVIELIRRETASRIVQYHLDPTVTTISISINEQQYASIPVQEFEKCANELRDEITYGSGSSFEIPTSLENWLKKLEITSLKGNSKEKSDLWLTVIDPRTGETRKNIGFSIKSEFGHPPTLFNTAKASAAEFELPGLTLENMAKINSLVDARGKRAVRKRWQEILSLGINPVFIGFRYIPKACCRVFQENLELINPYLAPVFSFFLQECYAGNVKSTIPQLVEHIVQINPLELNFPELKYPYMVKDFLYAAYCGLTASTLWSGKSEVNGGFIKVSKSGEVLGFYALESDSFKEYLFRNCYMEFPSTQPSHGDYGEVYQEDEKFFFRLNFQIRYKVSE